MAGNNMFMIHKLYAASRIPSWFKLYKLKNIKAVAPLKPISNNKKEGTTD
jgi:hypothetical protein